MELTISRRILWFTAVLAAVVLLAVSLRPVLMPFIIAGFFAYLLNPLVSKLAEWRFLSRTLSVVLVFVLMALITALLMLIVLPLLISQVGSFVHHIPLYIEQFQSTVLPWLADRTGIAVQGVPVSEIKRLASENWQQAGGYAGDVLAAVTGSTMSMLAVAFNLMLAPVVAFYLLRDWQPLLASLRGMLPKSIEQQSVSLVMQCDEVLSAFIRGQLLVMLSLGVIYAAGLGLVGLQLGLFLGMLAGLASVVPYLGFIVGIVAASIAAWLQFHALMPLVWVAVVFGVGQVLESTVLTPMLVGDKIGLHPVAVIFAIMAGGQLAGFLGVLLALPIAAVLMVFVRYIYSLYQESDWYLHVDE